MSLFLIGFKNNNLVILKIINVFIKSLLSSLMCTFCNINYKLNCWLLKSFVGWQQHSQQWMYPRVTLLYTAGHLHTAMPHCSHSRAPIVHTAVPRENNEHGCVYLRCRAVYKLHGCVEGHPWYQSLAGTSVLLCRSTNMIFIHAHCLPLVGVSYTGRSTHPSVFYIGISGVPRCIW